MRRIRRRTIRRRPRRIFRRRIIRRSRVARNFTRPDGVTSLKFTKTFEVTRSVSEDEIDNLVINWVNNNSIAVVTFEKMGQCPEYPATSALYEMCKVKGLKIDLLIIPSYNLPDGRYIKNISAASFPNDSAATIVASIPDQSAMLQRLDYKSYSSRVGSIKRYYHVSKALKNAFHNPGFTLSGYMLCNADTASATRYCNMGATVFRIESEGFQPGDYIGRCTLTWYVNMKSRIPV